MQLKLNSSPYPRVLLLSNPFSVAWEVAYRVSELVSKNAKALYESLNVENVEDPFIETKKKCLPTSIDHLAAHENSLVSSKTVYFSTTPFNIEKRDWPSFTGETMPNLIVDNWETLVQLIFARNAGSSVPPNQKLMQVTEYSGENWKALARKFVSYT